MWPPMSLGPGDAGSEVAQRIHEELDAVGDEIQRILQSKGLPAYSSPLFRPWSLFAFLQSARTVAVFLEQVGTARVVYMNASGLPLAALSPDQLANQLRAELGVGVVAVLTLPAVDADSTRWAVERATVADQHVALVERELLLGRLGDLTTKRHLEPQLRQFLVDHPDPDRNVFIMMRFQDTPQFAELRTAIVDALAAHGLEGIRADDREYHPDLWSNVEVYLLGCRYGIAAFEDFEARDHNPNVALELGYMRSRDKRCLILKERTLPSVPTDVVGSLYKAFDKFDIASTVSAQVERWITVDLGLPWRDPRPVSGARGSSSSCHLLKPPPIPASSSGLRSSSSFGALLLQDGMFRYLLGLHQ